MLKRITRLTGVVVDVVIIAIWLVKYHWNKDGEQIADEKKWHRDFRGVCVVDE